MARCFAALLTLLGSDTAHAALNTASLKTIPLLEVIRLAMGRYQVIEFVDEAHRREDLNEIAALDPKVQTLVWLALLDHSLTEQTEANGFAPSAYIDMGLLHERIGRALADAGLITRAAVFLAATAGIDKKAAEGVYPGQVGLGKAFGTKAAFDDALVSYARAEPVVSAWLENARERLPDRDRLRALLDALWTRDAPDWLTTWPEPYRVLLLADMFDGEVGNGGIDQYFYNATGDIAPDTVAAMRALGLPKHADAIERGMRLFPRPYPTDQTERRKAFDHEGFNDWDNQLESLTEVVGYDAVRPAMIAYAKQRDLLPR